MSKLLRLTRWLTRAVCSFLLMWLILLFGALLAMLALTGLHAIGVLQYRYAAALPPISGVALWITYLRWRRTGASRSATPGEGARDSS